MVDTTAGPAHPGDGRARRRFGRSLGPDFNRLWAASASSNLADGVLAIGAPLIMTTLTDDPLAIAAIVATAAIPWLLLGMTSGMLVDRFDRRRLMAVANTFRFVMGLATAVVVATGHMNVPVLLAAALMFGIGEVLFDNATTSIIPTVVEVPNLERANGRIMAAQITLDNFVSQPIGSVLFAAAISLPFWVGAAGYALPIMFALALPAAAARGHVKTRAAENQDDPSGPESLTSSETVAVPVRACDGWTYLRGHTYLWRMTLLSAVIGIALSLAQATLILLFLDEHGVAPVAIGFITAAIGVGALAGSLFATRLVFRFGRSLVMWAANALIAVGLAGTALAPNAWLATGAFAVAAFGVATWNVPWGALRQQIVPGHLFGRVLGVVRMLTWGTFPIAALAGGLISRIDLRLPWAVGAGTIVLALLVGSRTFITGTREMGIDFPPVEGVTPTGGKAQ